MHVLDTVVRGSVGKVTPSTSCVLALTALVDGVTVLPGNPFLSFQFRQQGSVSWVDASSLAGFDPVASTLHLTGLGLGPHSMQVRSVHSVWGVDNTPTTVSWTVVPSRPGVTLARGPSVVAATPVADTLLTRVVLMVLPAQSCDVLLYRVVTRVSSTTWWRWICLCSHPVASSAWRLAWMLGLPWVWTNWLGGRGRCRLLHALLR